MSSAFNDKRFVSLPMSAHVFTQAWSSHVKWDHYSSFDTLRTTAGTCFNSIGVTLPGWCTHPHDICWNKNDDPLKATAAKQVLHLNWRLYRNYLWHKTAPSKIFKYWTTHEFVIHSFYNATKPVNLWFEDFGQLQASRLQNHVFNCKGQICVRERFLFVNILFLIFLCWHQRQKIADKTGTHHVWLSTHTAFIGANLRRAVYATPWDLLTHHCVNLGKPQYIHAQNMISPKTAAQLSPYLSNYTYPGLPWTLLAPIRLLLLCSPSNNRQTGKESYELIISPNSS